jgi:serine/threonine protein kinase
LGGYSYAAKIFLADRPFPTAKILAMLANPPSRLAEQGGDGRAGRLAWPVAILSDEKGQDVGFLMPVVDLTSAYPLDYFYDQTLFKKLKSPNEAALSFKLEIARNLSALVADLHYHGHCFIDMKPQNIRVTLNSHEVCLLDCDGFSISGPSATRYPAELLSTDYISPEAFRGNTPPSGLGEEQDRYALAVLLFQLLNRGTHPFQGIPVGASVDVATNDEKAARGMYPHGCTPHASLRPRPHSIHEQFDAGLRALFDQAFVGSPSSRPSAKDWAHKFDQLLTSKALARCDKFPNDVSHMRFRGKLCPACYLAAQPDIKVPPSTGPKTPLPRAEIPPAPAPSPLPNPTGRKAISEPPIGLILLGFLGFFVLAALWGEPKNPGVGTEPPQTAPTPSSCTATFYTESPQRICELYWSNQMPVCDPPLREELQRRQLSVHPQASCGQPDRAAGAQSSAPTQLGHFSIFVSDDRAAGWAIGEPSQQEADGRAKGECQEQAAPSDRHTCKRLISGQAKCIAISIGLDGALGASFGESITAASRKATEQCRVSGGQQCEVPPEGSICQ